MTSSLSFTLSKAVLPLLRLFRFNPFPWTLFLIHYFLFSSPPSFLPFAPLLSFLLSCHFSSCLSSLFFLFHSSLNSSLSSNLLFFSLLMFLCQICMTTQKKREQKHRKWWKTRSSIPPWCPGWPTRTDMSPRTLRLLIFYLLHLYMWCSSFELKSTFLSKLSPPSLLLILPITYVPTRISSSTSYSLPFISFCYLHISFSSFLSALSPTITFFFIWFISCTRRQHSPSKPDVIETIALETIGKRHARTHVHDCWFADVEDSINIVAWGAVTFLSSLLRFHRITRHYFHLHFTLLFPLIRFLTRMIEKVD